VEIDVRWEETDWQVSADMSKGNAVNSVVLVDRDIATGSILRLGTLASLPSKMNNLFEVIGTNKVPDIKGVEYQWTCMLTKRQPTLPTVV
jgi:hypothetical protein